MHDSNEYIKAIDKISVDKSDNKVECRIITAKLAVFLIKLFSYHWSLIVVIALPYIEKSNTFTPIVLF
jgi:hypothetical protein